MNSYSYLRAIGFIMVSHNAKREGGGRELTKPCVCVCCSGGDRFERRRT